MVVCASGQSQMPSSEAHRMQNRQLLIKRIQPLVILLTDDARHGEMERDSCLACCSMFLGVILLLGSTV